MNPKLSLHLMPKDDKTYRSEQNIRDMAETLIEAQNINKAHYFYANMSLYNGAFQVRVQQGKTFLTKSGAI